MLNIINHQGPASLNNNKISPPKCQNGYHSNKKRHNKCWQGCGETGTLVQCWWAYKLLQPLWKTVWMLLKKFKIETPYNPEILVLGIHPKNIIETLIWKDICTPVFIASLLTTGKIWKQANHPSKDEWIKKMW